MLLGLKQPCGFQVLTLSCREAMPQLVGEHVMPDKMTWLGAAGCGGVGGVGSSSGPDLPAQLHALAPTAGEEDLALALGLSKGDDKRFRFRLCSHCVAHLETIQTCR